MARCNDCSCEIRTTNLNITPLQKLYLCKKATSRIINLTEVMFCGVFLSYIYYKYKTTSLKKIYNLNKNKN